MLASVRLIVSALVSTAALSNSALAADASAVSAACPAPEAKDAPVAYIKNPAWIHQPSGEDVTRVYPPYAYKEHKRGHTAVDCAIGDDGALKDCTVVEDQKPGQGFDKAALSLTKLFKMPPLASQAAYTGMPECIRKLGPPHVVIPINWSAGG